MIDALLRRQHYLQRYATGLTNKLVELLRSDDKALIAAIRSFFDNATDKDIAALLKQNTSNIRVKTLLDAINQASSNQQSIIIGVVTSELAQLATGELVFIAKSLNKSASALPAVSQIIKQPILGSKLEESWTVMGINNALRIKQAVINAAQDSLDPVAMVRGTRQQNFRDGVLFARNSGINTAIQTHTLGVTSNARAAAYERFNIDRVQWIATLDGRTTPICRARDGETFPLAKAPKPPAHWRCRSILAPYLGEDTERPFVADTQPVKKIPKTERKDKIGQTTDDYETWFSKQPKSFQLEVLGKGRYELYKTGKVDLKQMVNEYTGKPLTLTELNKLN